jgi:hypothetical protein
LWAPEYGTNRAGLGKSCGVNVADTSRLLEMLQIVMAVTDDPCRVGQEAYCK